MIVGVPKETKNNEFRVGITPSGVVELVTHNHKVLIETNAGKESGFSDAEYKKAGAQIVESAKHVFAEAEMIVKVKEPQPNEIEMIKEDQVVFTYFHLAPDRKQTEGLLKAGCIAIAYETVTDNAGKIPLLAPMSEVAGRMSVQVGAHYLERSRGGKGVLLAGVSSSEPGKVLILGGGDVGENAARIAMGMGAKTVVMDNWMPRLKELDQIYGPRLITLSPSKTNIVKHIKDADVVIGAALIRGDNTPRMVTREMLKLMEPGSVLVDVAIDHGGCFETSKVTTHEEPTYVLDGIIHYCVPNMPGAVAKTSTIALTNSTIPYVVRIANKGWKQACKEDHNLKNGLNIIKGDVTFKAVANSHKMEYVDPDHHLH